MDSSNASLPPSSSVSRTGRIGRALGEFASGMSFDRIPREGVVSIRNALTDYAGCVVLGCDDDAVRLLGAHEPPGDEASLFFQTKRASAPTAALLNGAAGHAQDYDDIGLGFHPAHPSVAIAPAAFAEAQALGASGRDLIAAYATGYEVWGEIASRDAAPQHLKGWHPTGVFGAVASAAACARLRGLDPARALHAMAIAASMSSGLVANFGTMTKPFHAGHASRNGLLAARYAQAGMTASPDVFDDPRGFLFALSPRGEVDLERAPQLGRTWSLLEHGIGLKLYPMCYGAHRIIAALVPFAEREDLRAEEIAQVDFVTAPERVVPLVHTDPRTPLEAKFSAEFAVAMCVIGRRASLDLICEAFVMRPDVRELMGKVRRDLSLRGPASFSEAAQDALVIAYMDGRVHRLPLVAPDDRAATIDAAVLRAKFMDCVRGKLPQDAADVLFARLQALDGQDNVRF
ncbi:MAG: hypothetical protein JWN93_3578 [Hyphomicrobiales bacterium]|nr:hypothetical protein [Hyphomicrobiales bacterium]